MEKKNSYKIDSKHEGKRKLGRPSLIGKTILKRVLMN
jgi:hypothetical protein